MDVPLSRSTLWPETNRPCQLVYGAYVTTILANWHETVEYKDTSKCEHSTRMFIAESINVDHYF